MPLDILESRTTASLAMLSRLLESDVLALRESVVDTTVAESFVLESVLLRMSIVLFNDAGALSFLNKSSVLYSNGDFGRAREVTGTPENINEIYLGF